MDREYRQLRYDIEHKSGPWSGTLEVALAQHALVAIDEANAGVDERSKAVFSERLSRAHVAVVAAVRAKVNTAPNESVVFGEIVESMVEKLMQSPRDMAPDRLALLQQFFTTLYVTSKRFDALMACEKLAKYIFHRGQVAPNNPTRAWNALLAAVELGAWLDKTL